MEKNCKLPAIVWLKVTDYMRAWLEWELGGNLRVKNQKVVCIQHLPGAREALRMETAGRSEKKDSLGNSMSANWRNTLDAGIAIDPQAMEHEYHVNKDSLKMFVPIECPEMCMTPEGVLRPWSNNIDMGKQQAAAVQRVIRDAFWQAVVKFSKEYAGSHRGEKYAQADMIEDFCAATNTPDVYVDAMRREWQRRVKRAADD